MKSSFDSWSVNEVMKLYGVRSKTALLKAEKAGRIPEARRNGTVRSWNMEDLPKIGHNYGFLQKPDNLKFITICVFTVKGGVLKTTTTYSLARILALNGFKVLIAGNDPQTSITEVALNPLVENKSLDELPEYNDLGQVIFNDMPLSEAVLETNLPNLDILPETSDLSDVGDSMGTLAALAANTGKASKAKPRHIYFKEVLNPIIEEAGYDVVLYDNGPTLTVLNENALYASDYWITPNSCDQGAYQVFEKNLKKVLTWADDNKKSWKDIFIVPTLTDNTKLAKQIYAAYLGKYPELVTDASLKKTVKVQEALASGVSPIEAFAGSDISKEFKDLAIEVWGKILEHQKS